MAFEIVGAFLVISKEDTIRNRFLSNSAFFMVLAFQYYKKGLRGLKIRFRYAEIWQHFLKMFQTTLQQFRHRMTTMRNTRHVVLVNMLNFFCMSTFSKGDIQQQTWGSLQLKLFKEDLKMMRRPCQPEKDFGLTNCRQLDMDWTPTTLNQIC